ncbi:hypothetical protein SAY87_004763 [Trapa incisa]|uniref:Uncharacterized protein n=1 Tax=Trapa incisa TaxID=236973 RepID=A0AAN7JPI1_9MYRT|nr:hypothetical protein SAY87_004763 [Trapa incisa]
MEASSHEHNLLKRFLLENYRVGSQLYAYSLLFEFEQFLSDIVKGINMASTIEGLLPERLLLNEQRNRAGAIYCMSSDKLLLFHAHQMREAEHEYKEIETVLLEVNLVVGTEDQKYLCQHPMDTINLQNGSHKLQVIS